MSDRGGSGDRLSKLAHRHRGLLHQLGGRLVDRNDAPRARATAWASCTTAGGCFARPVSVASPGPRTPQTRLVSTFPGRRHLATRAAHAGDAIRRGRKCRDFRVAPWRSLVESRRTRWKRGRTTAGHCEPREYVLWAAAWRAGIGRRRFLSRRAARLRVRRRRRRDHRIATHRNRSKRADAVDARANRLGQLQRRGRWEAGERSWVAVFRVHS